MDILTCLKGKGIIETHIDKDDTKRVCESFSVNRILRSSMIKY